MNQRPKIAFIVQRYGVEVNGGAEKAALILAEQFAHWAEVSVLTTCALDYTTWQNSYPAGTSELNGVTIHRFPVDTPRNWERSQQETGRFMLRERTLDEEIRWIQREGAFSTPMLQYIKANREQYDFFFIITYLYAPSFFGLPLVADKTIFLPMAHDEPFLYMDAYRTLFHLPIHMVYMSDGEKQVVQQITGNHQLPSTVVSYGIDAPHPNEVNADAFRQKFGLHGEFILYSGRVSEAKNVPELIRFFQRYRAQTGRDLKLAFTGNAHIPIPNDPNIVPLGFLSEADKFAAMKAATLFVLPSLYESFSIVIMEAWMMETPVLVNAHSIVTRQHCHISNGGLYYKTYVEFAQTLTHLLNNAELREKMGANGRYYVQSRYTWPRINEIYQGIVARYTS